MFPEVNKREYPIVIPPYWIQRAKDYAAKVKANHPNVTVDYAAHPDTVAGGKDFSARCSEIATCFFYGADPQKLNWKMEPDIGWDVKTVLGWKIDVKSSTHPRARAVLWAKNQKFEEKGFDYILWSRVKEASHYIVVDLVGVISKQKFQKESIKENYFEIFGIDYSEGSWAYPADSLADCDMLLNVKRKLPWER
jgi:hypothetical protein